MNDGSIGAKVAHVKSATQSRRHHCHWPGCETQCPPAMWGCRDHWYRLPQDLRDKVWATYRPGQELNQGDLRPSAKYIEVAKEVQAWIRANHPEDGLKQTPDIPVISPEAPQVQKAQNMETTTATTPAPGVQLGLFGEEVSAPSIPPAVRSGVPDESSKQLDLFG
jgi:hypothetical protein